MIRIAPILFLFLCLTPARADEKKPAKPLTPGEAADAVLRVVAAKDADALKALASKDDPDPWIVADELCDRGEHDAAEAYAKSAPRKVVEELPGYLALQAGKAPDSKARRAFEVAAAAQSKRRWRAVLDASSGSAGPLDSIYRLRIDYLRARALGALRQYKESAEAMMANGGAARELGWLARAAEAYHQSGISAFRAFDWKNADAAWTERIQVAREVTNQWWLAQSLNNRGLARQRLGEYARAKSDFEEALRISRALENQGGVARSLTNLGMAHQKLGEITRARVNHEAALAIHQKRKNVGGIARARHNLGIVAASQSDYEDARAHYESALDIRREIGKKADIARTLNSLGNIFVFLGDYATAFKHLERALELRQSIEDRPGIASTLHNIGMVYRYVGHNERAAEYYEKSLALKEQLGNKQHIARSMAGIGMAYQGMGQPSEALSYYRKSFAIQEAIRDKVGMTKTLVAIAVVQSNLARPADAIASYDAALAAWHEMSSDTRVTILLGKALAHDSLGDRAKARDLYDESLLLLEATANPGLMARTLWGMASMALQDGRPKQATEIARRGVLAMNSLSQGLSQSEGAGARDTFAQLFDIGYRAASRSGQPNELFWFLEQGKAGSLRESLGSRAALEGALLSPRLRKALAGARLAERKALRAYQEARTKPLKTGAAARARWLAAHDEVAHLGARIERESKGASDLTVARTDSLAAMQQRLKPEEAFVHVGLTEEEGVALIVRKASARIALLPSSKSINAAMQALLFHTEPYIRPTAVPALRRLLVEPLELSDNVTRVLLSPAGRLGYVPFRLLLPDKDVALVPSATTHGLLLTEREHGGTKVLALGDPDYGRLGDEAARAADRAGVSRRLRSLPGTRLEVQSIADVYLLGKDATETALQEAVGRQKHWRAVHLACHGLLDPERPLLSSLALTADAANDGFLTALEVFRMKIPADLVVLSACESGKGKIYKTEGIVGLTRAFMFAGAPRVLCSLWKVDDEATRALMVKFYDLWNPQAELGDPERAKRVEEARPRGLGAAAALRHAQEYVRTHTEIVFGRRGWLPTVGIRRPWAHPRYWAAWVLWGLPD